MSDDAIDLSFLEHLSEDDLREMLEAQSELERRLAQDGPQTDDELHVWLISELDLNIPRVSVCEDHDAPFDFIADLFFERTEAALLMANRGGSKTFLVALLHWLNSRFKPGCLAADTPIDCPRDHRKYPLGVPLSEIRPGQHVWTLNESTMVFELKPVVRVWMSRENAPVFKMTLDDGSVVRATEDHRFMRRDGSWSELRDLRPGDSLMPLYRDFEPYVRTRADATNGGGMVIEYHALADALWPERKGFHVDHIDGRRENSGEDNLQLLTPAEHCRKTHKGRKVGSRRRQDTVEQWQARTEEEKAQVTSQISASLKGYQKSRVITNAEREAFAAGGSLGGKAMPPLAHMTCENCGGTWERQPGGRTSPRCPSCEYDERTCPICFTMFKAHYRRQRDKRTCSRGCGQRMRHQQERGVFNHKIVSIEFEGHEDVWDMEVQDNHNFVTAGIVAHNCESCTFGATEAQSLRAYAHLKGWIYEKDGSKRPEIAASIMRETTWRNGSKVEVLPGTPAAVNGPHPQKAHADEVELMDEGTWQESRNMTVSKQIKYEDAEGNEILRVIKPQDIATSTRKGPNGRMQQLIDEISAAIRAGMKPPRKLYAWCIKETAAQVPNCQVARPNLPPEERCECHLIAKGEWEPGRPRLLRDICGGDFYKSRGWQPFGDVAKQFRENNQETFEVQQLCAKPEMSHHYVPGFTQERYGLRDYQPDPERGPIFLAVDWGGTNPHAVNWYQLLTNEVDVTTFLGDTRRLKEGTVVCFDEIYIAEIGNDKLADLVIAKEARYKSKWPGWKVQDRFADPQGKAARIDWRDKGLKTSWHTTREFEEHIKVVKGLFEDDLMYVDAIRCPMWVGEIKAWRRDPKTHNQIDEFNHAMSNFRYAVANIRKVKRRAMRRQSVPRASTIPRQSVRVTGRDNGPIGLRGGRDEFSEWRKSLGEPVTRVTKHG